MQSIEMRMCTAQSELNFSFGISFETYKRQQSIFGNIYAASYTDRKPGQNEVFYQIRLKHTAVTPPKI